MVAPALTPLPFAAPLVGAALLAALRKWLSRAAADSIAVATALANVCICALLLHACWNAPSVYWFGNWFPRGSVVLGISFVVEPIGVGLALLASLLTLLALVFSWRLIDSGSNHLQPLMLIFLAAMCGFSMTADVFNLFVCFELMSTAAFALCGLKVQEPAPLQGAFNFAITNTIAAFLVLTGIALLYAITGALNMAQIGLELGPRHDPLVLFAFTLLTCGFLVKAAAVPFHLWLPDAHAVSPTPVCVLFSGIMVQLGLVAVARLRYIVFGQTFLTHPDALRNILLTMGALTIVIGGVMCYAEHHLKRLLAFSTVCHSGILLCAVALGGPLGVAAMLTYLLAHAFVKSSLFLSSGIILHRLRFIGERDLFGRGKAMHATAALWFLGGLGLAAAPPFLTWTADAGIARTAHLLGLPPVSYLCMVGGVLTSAAVFRVGMHTFLGWGEQPITDRAAEIGEMPETREQDRRTFAFQFLPAAFCVACAFALPFVPVWQPVLRSASSTFTAQPQMLHLVYQGSQQMPATPGWKRALPEGALHGGIAVVAALLLALSSVFRNKVRRPLRAGAFLESNIPGLRAMQSGHPGDYVLWLTIGVSTFGAACMVFLR